MRRARSWLGAAAVMLTLAPIALAATGATADHSHLSGQATAFESLGAASRTACATRVAPYMYGGWGDPQDPGTVIRQTGVRCFTIAFVLDRGHCTPGWGSTALTRGPDARLIRGIRANRGDVIPSSGGASDRASLENRCVGPRALAAAYGRIVRTLAVLTLDIDLEGRTEANPTVRTKVLRAVSLLHRRHPQVRVILTVPVDLHTLGSATVALVRAAAATRSPVAVWSLMPFDNGGPRTPMVRHAITAATQLHTLLHRVYPHASGAALYAREGLSEMNGRSDTRELTTVADFRALAGYARRHRLGRMTYWAVNRDRPCPHRRLTASVCSGTAAPRWAFARALVAPGH